MIGVIHTSLMAIIMVVYIYILPIFANIYRMAQWILNMI